MYSQNSQGKASKGSVQTKISNSRIQLVFSHRIVNSTGGSKTKRFYLSTGYDNTPIGKQRISVLAVNIQRDIDYSEFDASLAKYKPATFVTDVEPINTCIAPKHNLSELWERYTEFKKPQVSQSTFATDYRKYQNPIALYVLPYSRLKPDELLY